MMERAQATARLRSIQFLAEEALRITEEGEHSDVSATLHKVLRQVENELQAIATVGLRIPGQSNYCDALLLPQG